MVFFNPSSDRETPYHDIEIDDPALTEFGFTKLSLPVNGNAIKMVVHNDTDKSMITYVDFDKHNIKNSVKFLEDKLSYEQKIDRNTAENLVSYFRNACVLLEKDKDSRFFKDKGNANGKSKKSKQQKSVDEQKQEQQKTKKELLVQRFTRDNLIAEAVIIGNRPKFAMAVPKVGNPEEMPSITLQDVIEVNDDDNTTVIKPLELTSYVNKPYSFKSVQEFEELVENIKTKNLDILYKKVKSIWNKYVDADDFHISICAADTIFTYFRKKWITTWNHYLHRIKHLFRWLYDQSGKEETIPQSEWVTSVFAKIREKRTKRQYALVESEIATLEWILDIKYSKKHMEVFL